MIGRAKSALLINPIAIDRVILRVGDLHRSTRFYCDVLGCRVARRLKMPPLVQLNLGRSGIDLIPIDQAETSSAPLTRFALRLERFSPSQIRLHFERHGIACEWRGEVPSALGFARAVSVRDPDGYELQLVGPAIDWPIAPPA
jgi:glyoxylase I family protein